MRPDPLAVILILAVAAVAFLLGWLCGARSKMDTELLARQTRFFREYVEHCEQQDRGTFPRPFSVIRGKE